jgi:hypothetical protein
MLPKGISGLKGEAMSRNRETNRAKVKREEQLNGKNEYGASDPTPKNAVANIIKERRNTNGS